ncbi:AP-1 complex subunit gamma-2 [Acorus calamus]|uniref:AP-1 complex subunit gamma-2 n=1 Tax=Acorus calamus TaxID=4465 RepID=A0AAV9CTZ8_ACOCL|nr:AP-1 complex subunit gamma-2 [Acorus calamus]
MLMKAVAVDAQAVQRHRATILECVKDSDASIRKRALELVFLLVNDTNVKLLTKELIEYLEDSDQEFKEDLTAKICSIVEKFSFDKFWYIDQMLKVLIKAGNFVKDEIWHTLIVVISNALDLHGYTVRSLYKALQSSCEQESLVRVAVWCIGEYGELLINNIGVLDIEEPMTVTESDAVDVVEISLKRNSSDITTRSMSLISLLKLSSRFPPCSERIRELIIQQNRSLVLELQQRSLEFNAIIQKHQDIKSSLVEKMPVLDELAYHNKKSTSTPANLSSGKTSQVTFGASVKLPNGVAKSPAAPTVDLLDSSSDGIMQPMSSGGDFLHDLLDIGFVPSPSSSGSGTMPTSGVDALLDLLSIGATPVQNDLLASNSISTNQNNLLSIPQLERSSSVSPSSAPTGAALSVELLGGLTTNSSIPEENAPYPSIVAYQSDTLIVTFSFSKQPGDPQKTCIKATYTNLSPNVYTDFLFQAAVPKFFQLKLDPASSNILPSSGNGPITQSMVVTNSQQGQRALAMRLRISYKVNNQDKMEQGQVNNFPDG